MNVNSSGIFELNFTFAISGFGGFSSLLSAFDQYCIYSVVCNFSSNVPTVQPIRLHTAIDYDSVSNLSSIIVMQGYSTYEMFSVASGASALRYIKPCIAPQVTSSNLPVAGGISRAWLDSGYSSVTHYGLRLITAAYAATVVDALEIQFTAICGFRNHF